MDASELRIGNWCKRKTQPEGFQIDAQSIVTCSIHPNWYKPIPITEEWLVNMGFERSAPNYFGKHHYYIKGGLYSYRLIKDSLVVDEIVGVELKYVHELQNLYHALTGKELELNQLVV